MKKLFYLAAVLPLAFSCSCDEKPEIAETGMELRAEIPAYVGAMGTRLYISPDLHTYHWISGDQIGIYYQSATMKASAEFTLLSGVDQSVGNFYNEAFSLKPGASYYAFYPYSYSATVDACPISYDGQVQTQNGSTAHVERLNYMRAPLTTDADGKGRVDFQNLNTLIQLVIKAPEADTYQSLSIASDGQPFITAGTASMITGEIAATATAPSISLSLGSGVALQKSQEFTAYLVTAPVDMSQSAWTVSLTNKQGKSTLFTVEGKELLAGKYYTYTLAKEENTEGDSHSTMPGLNGGGTAVGEPGGNGTGTLIPGIEHHDDGTTPEGNGNGTGTLNPGNNHEG